MATVTHLLGSGSAFLLRAKLLSPVPIHCLARRSCDFGIRSNSIIFGIIVDKRPCTGNTFSVSEPASLSNAKRLLPGLA